MTINPDAADGQIACTDARRTSTRRVPPNARISSKIGTFSIGTQALSGPLEGAVYIGEPKPGDQYRLFLDRLGLWDQREAGRLVQARTPKPDRSPRYFENLPQVPFEDFELHLFASDRGLMATPTNCTIYTTKAEFYPWNATLAEQESTQVFGLRTGPHGTQCPGQIRPFKPDLGGHLNPERRRASLLHAETRPRRRRPVPRQAQLHDAAGPDRQPARHHLLPGGLDHRQRRKPWARSSRPTPAAPPRLEIGTTNVAAGPGSHPFHAVGKIYMAGPFQGAPLSLVAITPALAGPYDYGTVVVRVALHIDPLDAHVIADSETVPEIIGGIPIRMREIQVNIDKPNFMINPTNCSAFSDRLRRNRRPGHRGRLLLALPSPSTARLCPSSRR